MNSEYVYFSIDCMYALVLAREKKVKIKIKIKIKSDLMNAHEVANNYNNHTIRHYNFS